MQLFREALLLQFFSVSGDKKEKKLRFCVSGNNKSKQAGTGPSRRHIQSSKIAKGLPSVNLQYSKIE